MIDIQLVAFPQLGLARNPEAVEMMWQAMENGCDLVGGMPHGEKNMADAARHIEIAFEIAQHYNADIDMHIDETDDPYWHSLELLAEKTLETGWHGRVSAGHCCAMSAWDDKMAARIIEKVRQADIHVITNAPINLMLEGRGHAHPKPRGIARVKELLEAGVNVACGQDDLQNMFYPYGKMDPLEVALITAHAAHLGAPEEIQAAFDMPRYNAASLWPLHNYGLQVGAPANLIVLDAEIGRFCPTPPTGPTRCDSPGKNPGGNAYGRYVALNCLRKTIIMSERKLLPSGLPRIESLEMRDIVKRFPGVLANDHVNFDVNAGEIHALLGENGAGKSTLMKILYGLYQPNEGEILLNGHPIRSIRQPTRSITASA